jgi:Putative bacterial sensory transduction regulator
VRPRARGSGAVVSALPLDGAGLDALAASIDGWLATSAAGNASITAVDRAVSDTGEHRWYVRLAGEDKDVTTVWLTLGQRTLRYETYVMPAPEDNAAELYEHLLRRNDTLVGAHFSIGGEDAVYLRGELPVDALDEGELDRIVGSLYAYVERCFRGLLRIGFTRHLARLEQAER